MVKENQEVQTENLERRILAVDDIELRVSDSDGDNPKITGYAAKYNRWSEDMGCCGCKFTEKIRKGAFDQALEESDVRALKNHDSNLLLGRSTSGTLRLNSNSVGLHFEIDTPDTTTGRDIVEEIRRKDITGCSFSFTTAEDDWKYNEDGSVERTIIKVARLFDVGPVTYPAYPDTTVAARSLDAHKKAADEEQEKKLKIGDENNEQSSNIPEKRGKKTEKTEQTDEDKKQKRERQRDIESKYRKAGRIINRNKSAEV